MRLNMLDTRQRTGTEQTIEPARRTHIWTLGGLAALSVLLLGASPANAGDEFERAFRYEFGGTLGRIAAHEAVGVGRGVLAEVLGVNRGHGHHGARYKSSHRGYSRRYGAYSGYDRGYDRRYDRRYDRGYDRRHYDRGRRSGHYKHKHHKRHRRGHDRHRGGYRDYDCH